MQYKLKEEYFDKLKKKLLWTFISIAFVILPILTITQGYKEDTMQFDFMAVAIIVPVFILLFTISFYRIIKRQRKALASYRINIGDDLISREQLNTPTLSIHTNEISSITKSVGNHIYVKGKTNYDVIIIPSQMENFEEIEKRLEDIMLIVPSTKKTFFQRFALVLVLVVLALMITTYTSNNKILVVSSGVPAFAALLYFFSEAMKNKNLDKRAKRQLVWLALIVASIPIVVILKLLEI